MYTRASVPTATSGAATHVVSTTQFAEPCTSTSTSRCICAYNAYSALRSPSWILGGKKLLSEIYAYDRASVLRPAGARLYLTHGATSRKNASSCCCCCSAFRDHTQFSKVNTVVTRRASNTALSARVIENELFEVIIKMKKLFQRKGKEAGDKKGKNKKYTSPSTSSKSAIYKEDQIFTRVHGHRNLPPTTLFVQHVAAPFRKNARSMVPLPLLCSVYLTLIVAHRKRKTHSVMKFHLPSLLHVLYISPRLCAHLLLYYPMYIIAACAHSS
ncbi:unnamed protein product [Trichogramma brassicae]|uniref:Uncharacterized protein n=1 Tax=Trichogramma brassicae TaxID=86971 RepID=A0A6H5I5S8_9HYME|nr:unnamed protein product [Trichogramma brassicae]